MIGFALTLAATPTVAEPASEVRSETLAPLRKGIGAAAAGDCRTGLRLLAPALDGSATLPDEVRALLFDIAVSCRLKAREADAAYALVLAGTRLEQASDWLWRMRLGLEFDAKRHDAAVATVVAMSQGRGAALNGVPVEWLTGLDTSLFKADDAAGRRRLLAVLADAAYQPTDPTVETDVFRRRYAEVLADAGETDAALALVRGIESPYVLMSLSLDPRLRSAVPASFDARRAMAALLVRLHEKADRYPEFLGLVIQIASAQRQLGDPRQSLATLLAADPTAPGARAYVDGDEQRNWWWDAVARSHADLGAYDQAVAAMRRGMGLGENGQPNVSQTINLAEAQIRFGRPADALATLAPFSHGNMPVSSYGEMEMRFARGCATARARTGDPAGDIAFARAHARDHPQALASLLLCVGDLDGAAAAFVARLDTPDQRVAALRELSDYDPPPAGAPIDPVTSGLPALRVRADVQAAIARAGGTRTFTVRRDDF